MKGIASKLNFCTFVAENNSQTLQNTIKMAKITDKHIKAWEKFNEEVDAFRTKYNESGTFAWLYEDACTTRRVRDFKMYKNGVLTWVEEEMETVKGQWTYVARKNREQMWDEDDVKEWLKYWRACLRRAKKYYSMPTEVLDAIQEGERDDIEIDG